MTVGTAVLTLPVGFTVVDEFDGFDVVEKLADEVETAELPVEEIVEEALAVSELEPCTVSLVLLEVDVDRAAEEVDFVLAVELENGVTVVTPIVPVLFALEAALWLELVLSVVLVDLAESRVVLDDPMEVLMEVELLLGSTVESKLELMVDVATEDVKGSFIELTKDKVDELAPLSDENEVDEDWSVVVDDDVFEPVEIGDGDCV